MLSPRNSFTSEPPPKLLARRPLSTKCLNISEPAELGCQKNSTSDLTDFDPDDRKKHAKLWERTDDTQQTQKISSPPSFGKDDVEPCHTLPRSFLGKRPVDISDVPIDTSRTKTRKRLAILLHDKTTRPKQFRLFEEDVVMCQPRLEKHPPQLTQDDDCQTDEETLDISLGFVK